MTKDKLNIVEIRIDYIFKKYIKNMKYNIFNEPINEYCELYVQSEITQNIYHFTINTLDYQDFEKLDRKIIEAIKNILEREIIK